MRLTRLSVEGCGRFRTQVRIEGLGPGVNILSAGNEAGKSTLFRAIRTCLFERHNTTREYVEALATEGLSLPVTITVGFEAEGKAYEIRKSFVRSRSASLSCDGVEKWRNAEADEEVLRLLGIEQRSARTLDEAAYGILWVAQGKSFETPEPSEGAKSAFNAVIQQEVGTLVGGERARLLLNAVGEELGRYLTKSGQPKAGGPLDAAIRESTRLRDARSEAEGLLDALRQRLDTLDSLRRQHRAASDPAALTSLEDQLAEARARHAAAEKAAAELKRLAAEERDADRLVKAQEDRLKSLTALAATIDARRRNLGEIAAELAPLDLQEDEARRAIEGAELRRRQCQEELDGLEARDGELQRLESLSLRLGRRAELVARLGQLESHRARAAKNAAALAALSVDEAAMKALAAIEHEEAMIRAAAEAGAARVSLTASPGAGVTIDGAATEGQASRAVTQPLTIAVGRDVTITVTPPAGQQDKSDAAQEALRARLRDLLARHGAASAAELRERRAERVRLEQEAAELRAERAALGLTEDASGEIAKLSAAIASLTGEASRLLPAGTEPPAAEAIAAERQAIADTRGRLRAESTGLEAEARGHRASLTRLADLRGSLRGTAQALEAALQTDLALLPDADREASLSACAAELAQCQQAHRVKAAALEHGRASAPPPEEAERQVIRIERFASALELQRKRAEDLRNQIAGLEGEVKVAGGEGLGEAAADIALQQEMASAEAARLAERVEVLKLLRDTVQSCHDRRREELNRPLLRHLKPFLSDVFPEAEISFGEDFRISGLSRAGMEQFGRLSLGTQEQIAVLVRLAMGAMICERGTALPIILDDALVFSDDDRIEQMFDAINRAGRNQQVIVLTCRARSFASLGGRQLRIVGD